MKNSYIIKSAVAILSLLLLISFNLDSVEAKRRKKKNKKGDIGDPCNGISTRCKKGLVCSGGTKVKVCARPLNYIFQIDCHHNKIPKEVTQSKTTVGGLFEYADGSIETMYSSDMFGRTKEKKFVIKKGGVMGWKTRENLPVRCGKLKRAYFANSRLGAPAELKSASLQAFGDDPLFVDQVIYSGGKDRSLGRKAKKIKIGDENISGWCLSKNKDAMNKYRHRIYLGRCFEYLIFDPSLKRFSGMNETDYTLYRNWLVKGGPASAMVKALQKSFR